MGWDIGGDGGRVVGDGRGCAWFLMWMMVWIPYGLE